MRTFFYRNRGSNIIFTNGIRTCSSGHCMNTRSASSLCFVKVQPISCYFSAVSDVRSIQRVTGQSAPHSQFLTLYFLSLHHSFYLPSFKVDLKDTTCTIE